MDSNAVLTKQTDLGTIEISMNAIAALVGHLTIQTYGIAGLAASSRTQRLTNPLTRDPRKGIGVKTDADQQVTIDVYVIVNYGINIASIANSLITTIRYHVETQAGLQVKQVNIHIQGLRMP